MGGMRRENAFVYGQRQLFRGRRLHDKLEVFVAGSQLCRDSEYHYAGYAGGRSIKPVARRRCLAARLPANIV